MLKMHTCQLASHMYRKMATMADKLGKLRGEVATPEKVIELLELVVDMQIFIDKLLFMHSGNSEDYDNDITNKTNSSGDI